MEEIKNLVHKLDPDVKTGERLVGVGYNAGYNFGKGKRIPPPKQNETILWYHSVTSPLYNITTEALTEEGAYSDLLYKICIQLKYENERKKSLWERIKNLFGK